MKFDELLELPPNERTPALQSAKALGADLDQFAKSLVGFLELDLGSMDEAKMCAKITGVLKKHNFSLQIEKSSICSEGSKSGQIKLKLQTLPWIILKEAVRRHA